MPKPVSLSEHNKPDACAALAAARGEAPGSSAGGEQPKFTTYAETPAGPRHLIVKFSEREPSPVTERWRDLLLNAHRRAGLPATQSCRKIQYFIA
jgi:hypothetical protein